MEFKKTNLSEGEYVIVSKKPKTLGVAGAVDFYFNSDECGTMKRFAHTEVEHINGINCYDFYASGDKPDLDQLEEIVYKAFPRVAGYIISQLNEYYE